MKKNDLRLFFFSLFFSETQNGILWLVTHMVYIT